MYQRLLAPVALLALLVLTLVAPQAESCPRSCNCYQASEVHCTFRSLLTIPPGLPVHTRRINLGFNSIRRIGDNSLAGLKRVELLMLHSNDLHHLPASVFRDMKSLQILKLSYNKLREISSSLTFSGLTSLLRLYLDHNLLQHIHPRAFLQLPSLRLIRLQGNRLHQLHPHTLCTLSLLNTYYFSTLRHLDLSNNSLNTLPKETLQRAPLLETLALHANPWSCDCRMNWLLTWSVAHAGLMKCPGGPQCPMCDSPNSLQGQGLLDQTGLSCTSPIIYSPGRDTPLETELTEVQPTESFKEPLGTASLGLSDQQGNNVDVSCNITHSTYSQDIAELSLSHSSPLPLSLSFSLECPVERHSYEKLWRILAYYSETAVRLEREIMLSKAPTLAYRYRQTAETEGYYHTGVKASVKATPNWLLQSAISIQLNRAQSNRDTVHLIYTTGVSAQSDRTSQPLTASPVSHPWVMISTNHTITALSALAGSKVELSCPILSSGNPKVQWILPDGLKLSSHASSTDGRRQASFSGLLLQNLKLSDAGLYYCVALAGNDIDVLPLRLAVEESSVPPSGEQVGAPVSGTIGDSVTLSCSASGSPAPHVGWVLPDGYLVRRGLAISGGLTVDLNGSLSLSKPSLSDAGHYRCIAVNQYGSDSLSVLLALNPRHAPELRPSFPRGPQSAAGRSTRIRAPLLQLEEGSGDAEEEDDETVKSRHPRPPQFPPKRRYPFGNPRRRGPVRPNSVATGGGSPPSIELRRNRFHNRHRVPPNKQRIDPQKWADLLAKIRQKTTLTNNSQTIPTGQPTAVPEGSRKAVNSGRNEGDDTQTGIGEGERLEAETEGSSVDDSSLQEEDLQRIYPVHTETQTPTNTLTERRTVSSPVSQTDTGTHIQTEQAGKQEALPTTKPVSATNEIPEVVEENQPEASPQPSRTRLQSPQTGLSPNLVPSPRPQNPWNSRRRIGQRRRIINRPRSRPLTPLRPLPDLINPSSQQATTPEPTTHKMDMLLLSSTTTSPATSWTKSDHIRSPVSASSGAALKTPSFPVSNTLGNSFSEPTSPSLTPSLASLTSSSPSHTKTHPHIMTHIVNTPDAIESTRSHSTTPSTTHSRIVMAWTNVPAETHGIQTHTAMSKQTDRPPGKHSKETERNLNGVPHVSHSSSTHSSIGSSTVPTTATSITAKITAASSNTLKSIHSIGLGGSTTHLTTTTTTTTTTTDREDGTTLLISPVTTNPMTSTSTMIFIPMDSTRRSATSTPTTTTVTTTSRTTSTTPTTTTSKPSTTTSPTTTATSSTVSVKAISKTANLITTTITNKAPTSIPKISTQSLTTTAKTVTPSSTTTITTTSASTRAPTRERPSINQLDPRERPVSGTPDQSRPHTDWRNPGANYIPDSQSNRPLSPPFHSFPAPPRVPVLRSRPRIADPHIRTVSFPAESNARLNCEAEGEPKPSITWTKVSTGAVMSLHSRAQRFEVLPNGTLIIQNVQLQDRGTYICSAHSFLGRDRLLTTLEVWTRPPRMQLAGYREVTIHQGGAVHLECQADGVPSPLISWVLPDRSVLTTTVPSGSRINMDKNGTLHISVTLTSDRGVYRCVASNSAGAASASARLHVSSLPPVIQQPREEHLLLSPGMPVYAHCSARGAPTPTLRWRIPDGTLVRPSQFLHGNLFVLPNGTLHITKVGPKDAGSYECTASNAVGAEKRIVTIQTELTDGEKRETGNEGRKRINTENPSLSSSLHKDRTLSIPVYSSNSLNSTKFPPPSAIDRSRSSSSHISFYPPRPTSTNSPPKINKAVTASYTHLTNFSRTKLSSLPPPSTFPANNTRLSTSIVNSTRAVSSSPSDKNRGSAVLHSIPVSPFSKARIVSTSPSITTVQYGEVLHLHCTVTGNPPPTIIWRTSNRKLVDMHFSYDQRLKVHPNGTLSVQAVTEKDAGDYLCIARNKVADDYRLLRVSVATKPAKIESKQPFNQMVSFGKPLKVDCLASGLPDPAVRWSLPDGTMVNSVLQGADRGGRARRLTVFDNGTLLVPAVGMGEEGEYTCYAENQGGQDTMKVKVKVMMSSPPTLDDDRGYRVIKVRQGMTAKIRCQVTGDPTPTVTWFSTTKRVIPRSSGSGFYTERVVVVSDGTLEVRLAQKIDTGNYTCRAVNSAGERSMVVGLEVEVPNFGVNGHVGDRGWSSRGSGPGSDHSSRSGEKINSNGGFSDNNGRIRNTVPNPNINIPPSGFNPALRGENQNTFNRPVSGITTQLGSSVISIGVSGARNVGIKADNSGMNRNGPGVISSSNIVRHGHSPVTDRNPRTNNNNEVIAGKARNDANSSGDSGRITGIFRRIGDLSSSVSNNGAGAGIIRENGVSRSSNTQVTDDNSRNSVATSTTNKAVSNASNAGSNNSPNAGVGVVTTIKQQVAKGQSVLLPCPSRGSPPPRLAWLLPGNGVLPAPYYGSRLTVHRNGSLELRGVRASDGGTLVCVVRSDRGEARIKVELEVYEPQGEARAPYGTPAGEKPAQKNTDSFERPVPSLNSAQALNPRPALPETLLPRNLVTQKPPQRSPFLPAAPHPISPPLRSTGPASKPAVSTRTGALVSIINGETLHLPCSAPQSSEYTQGSLSWTLPSGKVLTQGESQDSNQYVVHSDGTLTVQQASVFDRGTYTCRSTSSDSSSVSIVTVPVIVVAYPPRIIAGPTPITYTRPGVAVELPCRTIATPQATVTWETPDLSQLRVMGQARIYGNRYLSPQGSLVIQNPTSRDTGFYRCTAKNVIGVDTKATYLHVI